MQVKGNEITISYATHVIGVSILFPFKDGNFSYMWSVNEKRTVIVPYVHFVLLLISLAR